MPELLIHHRETNTYLNWSKNIYKSVFLTFCSVQDELQRPSQRDGMNPKWSVSSFKDCLRVQHLCAQRDAKSHSFQSHGAHGA